ncbi:MAG: tRNA pseudouridine(55) synthase TruB [Myxococcota bacterium]
MQKSHRCGVMVVDKPDGPTSHDVVRWCRKALNTSSVGHAGTLDPMATGVLVVAVGQATKLVPYLTAEDKVYEAELTLGTETDSLDATGTVVRHAEYNPDISVDDVKAAGGEFLGETDQRAPKVSALKKDGVRLHKLARMGEDFEAPVRRVQLHALEVLDASPGVLRCVLHCGKGFYVRAFARDLAYRLGTVGHLRSLRRLRSGSFGLSAAVAGETLSKARSDPELALRLCDRLIPIEDACSSFPVLCLNEAGATDAQHGRIISKERCVHGWPPERDHPLFLKDLRGRLLAIGERAQDSVRVRRGFVVDPHADA